jgi:hypothetical protein
MKRILFAFAVPAMLTLASCGGEGKADGTENDSTATTEATDVDYTGMTSFDMNPHGLKTTLMVPEIISENGDAFPVNVTADLDYFTWDVKVGKEGMEEFHIVIEEADGEGNYIQREKDRLKNDVVFSETFVKESPEFFMYKAALPDGAGQRDYFHIYGVVKINNVDHIVKSFPMGEFSEVQAQDMEKAYLSIKNPA